MLKHISHCHAQYYLKVWLFRSSTGDSSLKFNAYSDAHDTLNASLRGVVF